MRLKIISIVFFIMCNDTRGMMPDVSPGKEIRQCDIPCLVKCQKEDIKKDSIVVVHVEQRRWVFGKVVAIIGYDYFVKDTQKSGKRYNIDKLYKIKQ